MVMHYNHTGRRLHNQTPPINAMAQSAIGGIAMTGWQEAVGGEEASMSLAIQGAMGQWDISRTPDGRPLANATCDFLHSLTGPMLASLFNCQTGTCFVEALSGAIRIGWAMLALATLRDGTWSNHVPQWPLAWV